MEITLETLNNVKLNLEFVMIIFKITKTNLIDLIFQK